MVRFQIQVVIPKHCLILKLLIEYFQIDNAKNYLINIKECIINDKPHKIGYLKNIYKIVIFRKKKFIIKKKASL